MLRHEMIVLTSVGFLLFVKCLSMEANPEIEESNSKLSDVERQIKSATDVIETSRKIRKFCRMTVCDAPFDCSECAGGISVEEMEGKEIPKPFDCNDIYRNGSRTSGAYDIYPQKVFSTGPARTYCDMTTDNGGWTVIQRRGDFGNPEDYFYRKWKDYKIGFGNVLKEFWIGNENIYMLTNQRTYQLRVELTSWEGDTAYITYDRFWIDSEFNQYKLHYGSAISGNVGDSLSIHNGMPFSTKDQDNDNWHINCAEKNRGAWWYIACQHSNLNGLRRPGSDTSEKGITWYLWTKTYRSLKGSEMKIRPINFQRLRAP